MSKAIEPEDEEWMNAPMGTPKNQPEPSELARMLRETITDSKQKTARPVVRCLEKQAEEACDIIDRQAAEIKEQAAEIERLKAWILKHHPPHKHDHNYYHDDCGLCQIEKHDYTKIKQALNQKAK
jgi:Ni,Fe-hydrogenase I large subunit